ncbi:catalase [Pseudomonas nitroreducens]|uniref:catalase n=1 Tax=Pseudomonas TaxID=286 RepID=UPI0009F3D892|nr:MULTISPECIES: catalase [Pseudomonas]MDG9856769.1 catalase [Pseudomonas nitroreducens]MDH1072949.1 catalase [Pseudomonas nitroreducens]NMZ72169.1 catalase [Pseudomonas nitroreducens]
MRDKTATSLSNEQAFIAPVADASAGGTIDIVMALKRNAGNPGGARASFAKGQCVSGTFTPAPTAASVTCSRSFTESSQIFGRFSVGGGNPGVSDGNRTVLRGFSFRVGPDGYTTDLLTENAPVHFARTVEQMKGFLDARAPASNGTPDAERVKAFSAANPETLHQAQFVAARPLPGSFVGSEYWAVHAFPATNAQGQSHFIKFKLVPAFGEVALSDEQAREKGDSFLLDDLKQRIADGTAQLQLMAILGRPGDPIHDVTARWPDEDSRESVLLGTLSITSLEDNGGCDQGIFNPGNLSAGIGRPVDEMFSARLFAYVVSLDRRRS